jgi:hypothetical protein
MLNVEGCHEKKMMQLTKTFLSSSRASIEVHETRVCEGREERENRNLKWKSPSAFGLIHYTYPNAGVMPLWRPLKKDHEGRTKHRN